jgi:hypothetical protein
VAAGLNGAYELEIPRTDDGEWVEIVHWPSRAEAGRVEQTVMAMPESRQARLVMDPTSVRMVLLEPAEA